MDISQSNRHINHYFVLDIITNLQAYYYNLTVWQYILTCTRQSKQDTFVDKTIYQIV